MGEENSVVRGRDAAGWYARVDPHPVSELKGPITDEGTLPLCFMLHPGCLLRRVVVEIEGGPILNQRLLLQGLFFILVFWVDIGFRNDRWRYVLRVVL